MQATHIVNPRTGRLIKMNSKQAIELFKLGLVSLPPVVEPVQEVAPELPNMVVSEPIHNIDKRLKNEIKAIAVSNRDQFDGISQEQSDRLLKKMLYEKLFINKTTKSKSKKPKKKVVIQSDSESDESSDDW